MPSLSACLGTEKFAEAYQGKHDPESVIKKLKYWKSGFQMHFVEIYKVKQSKSHQCLRSSQEDSIDH